MTLDAHLWGDPARILERKQQRHLKKLQFCAGCVNRRTIEFQGVVVQACTIKRAAAMCRCDLFKKENE